MPVDDAIPTLRRSISSVLLLAGGLLGCLDADMLGVVGVSFCLAYPTYHRWRTPSAQLAYTVLLGAACNRITIEQALRLGPDHPVWFGVWIGVFGMWTRALYPIVEPGFLRGARDHAPNEHYPDSESKPDQLGYLVEVVDQDGRFLSPHQLSHAGAMPQTRTARWLGESPSGQLSWAFVIFGELDIGLPWGDVVFSNGICICDVLDYVRLRRWALCVAAGSVVASQVCVPHRLESRSLVPLGAGSMLGVRPRLRRPDLSAK